jgi:hypothetical protein
MTSTRTFGLWTAGVLTSLLLPGVSGLAWARQAPPAVVTVRVQNEAHVPVDVLTRARADVSWVYRQAGVDIVWTDGTPADLLIVLRGNQQAGQMRVAAGEMGRSLVSPTTGRGRLAYLFYGRIVERGGEAGRHAAEVLGLVMAHEIGHLLGFAHTPTGLMRANWDQADWLAAAQGRLLFDRAQGELMRARIARAN